MGCPLGARCLTKGRKYLLTHIIATALDDRWAWALLIAASVSGILFSLAIRIEVPWLLAMGAVAVLAIWLALDGMTALGFAIGLNIVYGNFLSIPAEISAICVLVQFWSTSIHPAVIIMVVIVLTFAVGMSFVGV